MRKKGDFSKSDTRLQSSQAKSLKFKLDIPMPENSKFILVL